MSALSHRIVALNAMLAPYATPHDGRTREHEEQDDAVRTAFQRDRARIIHSQAFRRLAGKTQVFVAGEGDHYRTRLTHTLEVVQITRDLARALGLNEDLAECVALAHDLGHPPFGHAGQDALDAWMRSQGDNGFEHNAQSHRVVTVIEKRGTRNGLNLTLDIIRGLLKHGPAPLSLEAQLANVCDAVAYMAHDTDDGLRAGLFTFDELQTVPFAAQAAAHARNRNVLIRSVIIDLLAHDLLAHAAATFARNDVPTIDLSPDIRTNLSGLRTFLWERMYHHPQVLERTASGQACIRTLCDAYLAAPPAPVLGLQQRTGSSLVEAVKDHVASMTDGYAMRAISALK